MVAGVRHGDADYDDLLMSGVERPEARERVRADLERVPEALAHPARLTPGPREPRRRLRAVNPGAKPDPGTISGEHPAAPRSSPRTQGSSHGAFRSDSMTRRDVRSSTELVGATRVVS